MRAGVQALRVPLALESFYYLLQRLRGRLPDLRSLLYRESPPAGTSSQSEPLLQTVEHLQALFPKSACALSHFQAHFQRPLMG